MSRVFPKSKQTILNTRLCAQLKYKHHKYHSQNKQSSIANNHEAQTVELLPITKKHKTRGVANNHDAPTFELLPITMMQSLGEYVKKRGTCKVKRMLKNVSSYLFSRKLSFCLYNSYFILFIFQSIYLKQRLNLSLILCKLVYTQMYHTSSRFEKKQLELQNQNVWSPIMLPLIQIMSR